MSDETHTWLARLQQGDPRAAQTLWEGYFARLMRLAERRLGGLPRRVADEEDVALSAMNSFVQGARAGRFPRLNDETDLWRLLVTIASRKATAHRRRHFAKRRDEGQVRGESVFIRRGDGDNPGGIDEMAAAEPTPEFAAELADQFERLFGGLDDAVLRDIALAKLEGYTNEEIAARIGRNVRTVERKLLLIRECWDEE